MCFKKLLFIIMFTLCLPLMVNAEECNSRNIKIKNVEVKGKSEYVEELSDSTFENNRLNLDLKMYDVGDYIEYKLKVKNDSNENYYFNKDSLNINSDYFDYYISYKDNSNKIEPNEEKIIYLKVQYKKEVEKEKFFSGKYIDKNNILLNISNQNSIFSNPLTNNNRIIVLLGILLIVQVLLYFYYEKKKNSVYLLIIGLTLLLPVTTYALCKSNLDIVLNIQIDKVKPNPCTFTGDLVQGAEYINGQYTYRYMQEKAGSNWENIDNDGWGVMLTDKDSTDPVTTKMCTSINDKPIVSMRTMFINSNTTSIDLSSFDTSSVINMEAMFLGVKNVKKLDMSSFNTENVQTMNVMFNTMESLEKIYVNNFDTVSLTNINAIFGNCINLKEIEMNNWNISKITAGGVFMNTPNLKKVSMKNWKIGNVSPSFGWDWSGTSSGIEQIDVSGWNLKNTTSLYALFSGLNKLQEVNGLETWDTSNITNMSYMFNSCNSLSSIDLSNFNTENVTSISSLFNNCSAITSLDLSNFNTARVIDMGTLFYNCSSLEKLYLDNWNFLSVTNSGGMITNVPLVELSAKNWVIPNNFIFAEKIYLTSDKLDFIDVTNWDLHEVNNTNLMFMNISAKRLKGLDTWDTSNITNMSYMFVSMKRIEKLDLSSFDTSSVTDMGSMFYGCSSLKTIYASDKFVTSKLTNDSDGMFASSNLLVGGNGTVFDSNHVDKEYARIDAPGSPGYFTRK